MIQFKRLLTLTLITLTISAQGQILNGLISDIDEINITLGPNLSSLYNDNISSEIRQPKIGLSAQLGLIYRLNPKFSFNMNLAYERKGLKTKYQVQYYNPAIDSTDCKCTTSVGYSEFNSNLDYFIFSTLIRFRPHNTNLSIGAGPFIGHLFRGNSKRKNLWDNSYSYGNPMNAFNKTDFGISILLGYKFNLNEQLQLNTQLSDNFGIINISKGSLKTTTNTFSVSIGLILLLNPSN